MQRREIEVASPQGLNAAASARLVQIASRFPCDVSLTRAGRTVNAKSLMGVMMLAAGQGTRVVVEADGPDEGEALDAVAAVIAGDINSTQADSRDED